LVKSVFPELERLVADSHGHCHLVAWLLAHVFPEAVRVVVLGQEALHVAGVKNV
jgi:hypothetical protein